LGGLFITWENLVGIYLGMGKPPVVQGKQNDDRNKNGGDEVDGKQ
jgi:hypothetical protein